MHMKFNFYAVTAFLFLALAARAQTTAFTYQGQLNSSNAPATGAYDFRFRIFDANSNVVAGPLTNAPVGVTNGLFTVTLDFGASVFNGSSRSLEIAVRSYGDTNAYIALSPWQTLTSVPYAIQAIQAINASNAVVLTAPLQVTNLTGTIPNSLLSTNVAVLTNNVIFSGSVTGTNFTGNGYGLSNLPATSLIGTIPDARLSTNVALQSNPNLNFAGAVSATNFTGAGHGLTNVPGAFFWVTVAGTNSQIFPNVGFITTNNTAPVILTLPSSPSVGDVYKVAGVGAGGWIIAQNTNQMIAAGNLSDSIGAKLDGAWDNHQLVSHRLLRRRNQTGGNRQQRIHLDFDQFRRDLGVAQFFTHFFAPLLVFRRLFFRWNQTRGDRRLYHLHRQPARCHLHFNRFRCNLDVAYFFTPFFKP